MAADQVERIVLEVDERPALMSVDRANRAIATISQNSQRQIDSVVRSYEKKAALLGKTGVDRLAAERDLILRRVAGDTQATERIKSAYEKLAAAHKEADKSMGGLAGKFQSLSGAVKAAIGVGVVAALKTAVDVTYGFIKAETDAAEALGNLADRTGLTLKETELYTAAARSANVNVEALVVGVRTLSKSLEEGTEEGIKGKKMLKDLGVNAYDSWNNLKPVGQMIQEIGVAIAKLPDTPAKLRALTALFGRGGSELLPILKDLPKTLTDLRSIGVGIDDNLTKELLKADEALDRLGRRWDLFKKQAAVLVLGVGTAEGRGPTVKRPYGWEPLIPAVPGSFANGAPTTPGQSYADALQVGTANRMRNQAWAAYTQGSGEAALRLRLATAESNVKDAINDKDIAGHRIATRQVEALKEQLSILEKIEKLGKFEYKEKDKPFYPSRVPTLLKYGRPGAPALVIPQSSIDAANAGMDEARSGQMQAQLAGLYGRQQMDESAAQRALQHQIRMVELTAGPGGEAAAVEKIYQLRLAAAKTAEEAQDAQWSREEALFQVQKQRFDELRSSFEGLFDAAFSGARSFWDAMKRFALTIFLSPIKQQMASMFASAMTGRGGMAPAGFSLAGLGLSLPGVAMGSGGIGGTFGGGASGTMPGVFSATGGSPISTVPLASPAAAGGASRYSSLINGGLAIGGLNLAASGYARNNAWMTTAGGAMAGYGIGASMGMDPVSAGIMGAGTGLFVSGVESGSVAKGAAGGAILGLMIGGIWGAIIGAGVGALIGVLRKSAEEKCIDKVREVYGLKIDKSFAAQIVSMAKSNYGGDLDMAIRSASVRDLIELYAMSTGQKMTGRNVLRATTMAQSGGRMSEVSSYVNGYPQLSTGNVVIGGSSTATPSQINVSLDPEATKEFLSGRMATTIASNPRIVSSAVTEASAQNYNRRELAKAALDPGLVLA